MKRLSQPALPRRVRGFSLIEMVAAFLVFAIGMAVMMQILTASMRTTRQSSAYTMAALWAQSKLDTVGVGAPIEAGHSSGRFDDTYSWELDIQQVDPAAVEPPPPQTASLGTSAGKGTSQDPRQTIAQAGAGGTDNAPFDLYKVDLTVLWGGRDGANPRTAFFSTLRAMNPDPGNGMQGVGLNTRQQSRLGGGNR